MMIVALQKLSTVNTCISHMDRDIAYEGVNEIWDQ